MALLSFTNVLSCFSKLRSNNGEDSLVSDGYVRLEKEELVEKIREDRTIRIYLSRPYGGDLDNELEALWEKVFPKLEELCASRGYFLVVVDLRRGLTTEESSAETMLALALDEIDRCRPFFVGFLGASYGWHQPYVALPKDGLKSDKVERDDDLSRLFDGASERFKWLSRYRDRSVNEIEVMYGCLNVKPKDTGRSLFFSRESRGDSYSHTMQRNLATKLSRTGFTVHGLPKRQDEYLKVVYDGMKGWILREMPDPIPRDHFSSVVEMHETVARELERMYLTRPTYEEILESHAKRLSGKPLCVVGECGTGKSALLARWSMEYRSRFPTEASVMAHFTGMHTDGFQLATALRRILKEMVPLAGPGLPPIPDQSEEVVAHFPELLTEYAARIKNGRRLVLVLDAIDKLTGSYVSHDSVTWLPDQFPPNIVVVLSARPGAFVTAIEARGWTIVHLPPFTDSERTIAIDGFARDLNLNLTGQQANMIMECRATTNPLFLRALLSEVRRIKIDSAHSTLIMVLKSYLEARDCKSLFDRILQKWEKDFDQAVGKARMRTVRLSQVLEMLCVARHGLSEAEIRFMMPDMTQAHWSSLYRVISAFLLEIHGLITIFHDDFTKAILQRYSSLATGDVDSIRIKSCHKILADRFEDRAVSLRRVQELPWHLMHAAEWERLAKFVAEVPNVEMFFEIKNVAELVDLYLETSAKQNLSDGIRRGFADFERAFSPGDEQMSSLLHRTAKVLESARLNQDAIPLCQRAIVLHERTTGPSDPTLVPLQLTLARLYSNPLEADKVLRWIFRIVEEGHASMPVNVAEALETLADKWTSSTIETASSQLISIIPLLEKAVSIRERKQGRKHIDVASSLDRLAAAYIKGGNKERANTVLQRALEIREHCAGKDNVEVAKSLFALADCHGIPNGIGYFARACEIYEHSLGEKHALYASLLHSLAEMTEKAGKLEDAYSLWEKVLNIRNDALGSSHPDVGATLHNMAAVLRSRGKPAQALPMALKALEVRQLAPGKDSRGLANSLELLASLCIAQGELFDAARLQLRCLEVRESIFGLESLEVAGVLSSVGGILRALGRSSDAVGHQQRCLAIYEKVYGPANPLVAQCLNDAACTLHDMGQYEEALLFHDRALGVREQLYGKIHAEVAISLSNIAWLFISLGRYGEANVLLERALSIRIKLFGRGHTLTRAIKRTIRTISSGKALVFNGVRPETSDIELMEEANKQKSILEELNQHDDYEGYRSSSPAESMMTYSYMPESERENYKRFFNQKAAEKDESGFISNNEPDRKWVPLGMAPTVNEANAVPALTVSEGTHVLPARVPVQTQQGSLPMQLQQRPQIKLASVNGGPQFPANVVMGPNGPVLVPAKLPVAPFGNLQLGNLQTLQGGRFPPLQQQAMMPNAMPVPQRMAMPMAPQQNGAPRPGMPGPNFMPTPNMSPIPGAGPNLQSPHPSALSPAPSKNAFSRAASFLGLAKASKSKSPTSTPRAASAPIMRSSSTTPAQSAHPHPHHPNHRPTPGSMMQQGSNSVYGTQNHHPYHPQHQQQQQQSPYPENPYHQQQHSPYPENPYHSAAMQTRPHFANPQQPVPQQMPMGQQQMMYAQQKQPENPSMHGGVPLAGPRNMTAASHGNPNNAQRNVSRSASPAPYFQQQQQQGAPPTSFNAVQRSASPTIAALQSAPALSRASSFDKLHHGPNDAGSNSVPFSLLDVSDTAVHRPLRPPGPSPLLLPMSITSRPATPTGHSSRHSSRPSSRPASARALSPQTISYSPSTSPPRFGSIHDQPDSPPASLPDTFIAINDGVRMENGGGYGNMMAQQQGQEQGAEEELITMTFDDMDILEGPNETYGKNVDLAGSQKKKGLTLRATLPFETLQQKNQPSRWPADGTDSDDTGSIRSSESRDSSSKSKGKKKFFGGFKAKGSSKAPITEIFIGADEPY